MLSSLFRYGRLCFTTPRHFDFTVKNTFTSFSKINKTLYHDLFRADNYRNRIVGEGVSSGSNHLLKIDSKNLEKLSNSEFLELLRTIFIDTSKPIDDFTKKLLQRECFQRQPSFDNVSTFYCADILDRSQFCYDEYINAVIRTMLFKWDDLIVTKEDALLFAKFVSLSKSATMIPVMDKMEKYLRDNISKLSTREIGLICHMFFSTNNRIKEFSTLEALKSFIINSITDGSEFYLTDLNNMIKVLRHANFNSLPFFMQLGDLLCDKLLSHSSSFTHLSNMAFSYTSLNIHHERFQNRVTDIFCDKLENPYFSLSRNKGRDLRQQPPRLKDYSRLLWALSTFCLEIPDILKTNVLQSLKSDSKQAYMYPEIFIETLCALAVNGFCDPELLRLTFSPNFIKFKKERLLEQDYQLMILHSVAVIEGGFSEPLHPLTKEYFDSVIPDSLEVVKTGLIHRQGFSATIDGIQKLLGDWSLFKVYPIFNFSQMADIELQVDESGKPQKLRVESQQIKKFLEGQKPKTQESQISILQEVLMEFKSNISPERANLDYKSLHLRTVSKSYPKKICIKIMGRKQYASNVPILKGVQKLELRLLQKLGYDIYVIDPTTAEDLGKATEEQRMKVLKEILSKCGVVI